MQQTHSTDKQSLELAAPTQVVGAADEISPVLELATLLGRAGELSASMDLTFDAFMKSAWSAYVDARPGLREHIEDMKLRTQLESLRESGQIGQA